MIKQQLEAWRDYHRDEADHMIDDWEETVAEMEKITSGIDVSLPNNEVFLLAVSIEFNQYQTSGKIGPNLQQLMNYPTIHRHGLLMIEANKIQLNQN